MCVFCEIINKRGDEYLHQVFYEDSSFFAMLSSNPLTKGHTLVIPKKHFTNLNRISKSEIFNFWETSLKIAQKIAKKLHTNSYTLKINNEVYKIENEGHIEHLHIHIIPRYFPGETKDTLPKRETIAKLTNLKKILVKD